MESDNKIAVTILTGFLGAGKTTLINAFLDNNHDERIAIIENEFGSVNIDGSLLKSNDTIEVIELSNGCVCCSIKGELTQALYGIIEKIDNKSLSADRLILETTGLADPGPIIQTFFMDELLCERITLDAVVTLVDAIHVLTHLDEHRVCKAQIGFADRIILTKSDCVDEAQKEAVLERLHAMNSKADIVEAFNGILPKEAWLGINAFELSDTLKLSQGIYTAKDSKNLCFKSFSTSKPKHSWNDDIRSYVFKADDLDLSAIGAFMEEMIDVYGNDMLRYKGVLAVQNESKRLIVQGVHKVVGFDYGSEWNDDRHSLLVIIGRYLPYETLLEQFNACRVS